MANREVGHLAIRLDNHIYSPRLSEQYSSCPKDGQNWQCILGASPVKVLCIAPRRCAYASLGFVCCVDRAFFSNSVFFSLPLQLKVGNLKHVSIENFEKYRCIVKAIKLVCLFERLSATLRESIRVCSGRHISDKLTKLIPLV